MEHVCAFLLSEMTERRLSFSNSQDPYLFRCGHWRRKEYVRSKALTKLGFLCEIVPFMKLWVIEAHVVDHVPFKNDTLEQRTACQAARTG